MIGLQSRTRSAVMLLAAAGCLALATPARAVTEDNRTRLENYLSGLGSIEYFLPTPLGGPEMAAAVIRDAGGFEMRVVEMVNGRTVDRLTERMSEYTGKRPFTFLLTGQQFLAYPTRSWTDEDGDTRHVGDLKIYDMTTESPQVLFELDEVADLSFQAKGSLTASNLIWQPADHYINEQGTYPVKYNYFTVKTDAEGNYDIFHHLELLPDIGLVESARFNNRGIFYYMHDDLSNAIASMSKANIVTDRDQSVIFRNMDLLKGEMTDIEYQAQHNPEPVVDEARMFFWTGQYQPALRVLETRQRRMSDSDLALSGLCMAKLKRWPEADNITSVLASRNVPWLGDYFADLVSIAELQGLPRVVEVQLRALEAVDPRHPALVAAKARILLGAGQQGEAQRLLEGYLARSSGRDVHEARYELYGIYFDQNDEAAMQRLVEESRRGVLTDLRSYVDLKDYHDFSMVLQDLEVDQSENIKSPPKPLDDLTLQ